MKSLMLIIFFLLSTSLCAANIKCISVKDKAEDGATSYKLFVSNQMIHNCPIKNKSIDKNCSLIYSNQNYINNDSQYWANSRYNAIKDLNKLGFHFDDLALANNYALSLHYVLEPFNTQKSFSVTKTGILNLDLTGTKYNFKVDAFPRGVLAPTGMSPNTLLTNLSVVKKNDKVSEVTFTTKDNSQFKYQLRYQFNKLKRASLLYKFAGKPQWVLNNQTNYTTCK